MTTERTEPDASGPHAADPDPLPDPVPYAEPPAVDPVGADVAVPAADASAAGRRGLGASSVRSFVWSTFSWGVNRVAILGLTLLLARLLVPGNFGVVTAGLTVITFLDAALDLGVGAAVVYDQERGVSHRVRAAATVNLVLSVLVCVVGAAFAPLTSRAFGVPGQGALFAALFLYPLFRGAGQVSDAVLRRDLRFRPRTWVDVLRAAVRIAVSVPLALSGAGAWSLALGIVVSEAAALVLLWRLAPVRPTRRIRRDDLRALLGFGGKVTGIRVLGSFRTNVDYLVVGHALGAAALGYYGMAYRLPELLVANVLWIFSSVALPTYARARASGLDLLRSAMLRATRLVTLYGMAGGVALAVVARDAVPVLFSREWQPATTPMVLTSLSLAFISVGWASGDVFPALGRPGLLLWLDVPFTVVVTAAFVESARYGTTGVAAVHLITNAGYAVVRAVLAIAVTGVSTRAMLGSLAPGLVVGAAVAAGGLGVGALLPRGTLLTLVVESAACVVAGGVASLVVARPALIELVDLLRRRSG